MTYAQPIDVTNRLRRVLVPAEAPFLQILLDDIEDQIKGRVPSLDALVADGSIPESTVVRIEAWAVKRYVTNPDGKYAESIDDYSFTRDKAVSAGLVYLTEDEWDELIPNAGPRKAFTISTIVGARTKPDPWVLL